MDQIIEFAPGIDKIASGGLYPHQADGVAFLLSKQRAILETGEKNDLDPR